MVRVRLTRLALTLCTVATAPADAQQHRSGTPAVHPLSLQAPYRPARYHFLGVAIGDRTVVQLGESIHITREFPELRLGFVRYLHEELGFDVLALEGSALNAWLAMEHLYQSEESADTTRVAHAQNLAWFPLWQTGPMRQLMAYVARTQRTSDPLYLTSFDIQPGQSRATGAAVFDSLSTVLRRYGSPPGDTAQWNRTLSSLRRCDEAPFADLDAEVEAAFRAIRGYEDWIEAVAPAVARRRSPTHAAALRILPDNLRDYVHLCQAYQRAGLDAKVRQVTRDSLNAENALALPDQFSGAGKVILWAHHSHVYHNALASPLRSMGQHLLARAPDELYTIGFFAGGGSAIDVDDTAWLPLAVRRLRRTDEHDVERLLERVADRRGVKNFFVDLIQIEPSSGSPWFEARYSRFEARGRRPTVLARDFHGAVYVDEVHPTRVLVLPAWLGWAALAWGALLDYGWILLGVAVLGLAMVAWRRKRQRKLQG